MDRQGPKHLEVRCFKNIVTVLFEIVQIGL